MWDGRAGCPSGQWVPARTRGIPYPPARCYPGLLRVRATVPQRRLTACRWRPRATCEDRIMSPRRPRDGYGTVTPRIVVDDVNAQAAFLRNVFGATGDVEPGRPTEVRLGDSLIMISSSSERDLFPAFFYIYVDDADHTYERALSAGAVSIEAPLDTPYGDRRRDGPRPLRERLPDRPRALKMHVPDRRWATRTRHTARLLE